MKDILSKINLHNRLLDSESKLSYIDISKIDSKKIKIKNFQKLFNESIPILERMNSFYLEFDKGINYVNYSEERNINFRDISKELKNFPSFDKKNSQLIMNEIKEVDKVISFKLKINQKTSIKIHFYIKSKDLESKRKLFEKYIRIIFVFCKSFGQNINSVLNGFNIRFLLIDFPRKLDKNYSFDELSKNGIFNNSSGFTNKYTKELVLTRNSGLSGLLIHELIHLLDLDFHFWESEFLSDLK